jgi:hypothetical protein
MSTPYTIKSGDTLSRIAHAHGFRSWRALYDHPDNAAFRRLRPNPNKIFPGDVIQIPTPANPATAHPGLTPGPPVLVQPTHDCCGLVRRDKECEYSGSKSNYTCPPGYVKQCWTCTEGTILIGCGECLTAPSPDCYTTGGDFACSIWWVCAGDCIWCNIQQGVRQ